jgi:threonine synthase
MSDYIYKCSACQKTFLKEEIEGFFQYLCPDCGKADKNEPLKGVLLVEYNYDKLKSDLDKSQFLKYQPGKFWLYPQLWPLENKMHQIKHISNIDLQNISLSSNPVIEIQNENLFFFDDTRNPTYSYKDRASILVAIKALQLGILEISAASTGNAGSSIAGICARLGLKSHIFVPKTIPEAKRIQIQSYGAKLHIVNGDYDLAFDVCLEDSQKNGWYIRNTAYNPLTIEGKKSAAFDMFISMRGKIPEIVFVPVGDGVILGGLYKGFLELKHLGWLEKLPRLVAVVAEGSDALNRYIKTNQFEFKPAKTIADSISTGAPRNLFMAINAINESNGSVEIVSDNQILEAQKELAEKFGLLVEPAAAASYAGYIQLIKNNNMMQNEIVIIMLTGSGLKDLDSLKTWNITPQIK